jgi:hypothetical protein
LGNPNDAEAEITRLKDGRTALAFKAENAVDMETGAIGAGTTQLERQRSGEGRGVRFVDPLRAFCAKESGST